MNSAFFQGFSIKRGIRGATYWASRWLCLGISKVVFGLRVEGREHIPRSGAAIIAANHVSFLDPVVVAIAAGRPIHFMAKEELFRFRPFGWLLQQYHVFPVSRRRADLHAMKRALSLLEQGEIIVIFPEGTRGDGSQLGAAKPGIGLIAARSGAPVIPAFHRGAEKALPRGARFPRPHRITVKFGAPFRFAEVQGGEGQGRIVAFSQTVMARIGALSARAEGGSETWGNRTHTGGETMPTKIKGFKEQGG